MRKSGTRIKSDIGRIHSDPYTELCRNGISNVFVRNRKMPLPDLAFSMINRKGLTLKLELREYLSPWNADFKARISETAHEVKSGSLC